MKKLLKLLFLIPFYCSAVDINLIWDKSPDITIKGYKIYSHTNSFNGAADIISYTQLFDVGTNLSFTFTNLVTNKWYFVVTAYDNSDKESVPSNELIIDLFPFIPPPPETEKSFITNVITGTLRNNFNGFLGMNILVGENPITVTALGRMMLMNNNNVHTVKLVKAIDGIDVIGGSVDINMIGGTVGKFKYANLTNPIVLSAKTSYYLVSKETENSDLWYDWDTIIVTTSEAVNNAVVWGASGWNTYGVTNRTYIPVDFKMSIIPIITTNRPVPPFNLKISPK